MPKKAREGNLSNNGARFVKPQGTESPFFFSKICYSEAMQALWIRLLFIFIFLLVTAGTGFGQNKSKIEISLDKSILSRPCRYPFPAKYRTCPDGITIAVSAKAVAVNGRKPAYNYTVSGGVIVGSGADVIWDMSKAMPGTYVITLSVGSGKSKASVEKRIKVEECPDCTLECLECPHDVLKSSKDEVSPGEIIEIVLDRKLGPKYSWNVHGGTVVEGQGTDRIKLLVDAQTDKSSVIVTLTVLDEFCFEFGGCPPPQIELLIVKKN